jgi:hypothetical protein
VLDAGYPGEGWELVFESGDGRLYRRITN